MVGGPILAYGRREYIQCVNKRHAKCAARLEHYECVWSKRVEGKGVTCDCVPVDTVCSGGLAKIPMRTWRSSLDKHLLTKMRAKTRVNAQELASEGASDLVSEELEAENDGDQVGEETGEKRDERNAQGEPTEDVVPQSESEVLDAEASVENGDEEEATEPVAPTAGGADEVREDSLPDTSFIDAAVE